MTINLKMPPTRELRPRITVLGVGGAGGNAVNNMIEAGLEGVDFVVANTDAQALSQSKAERRIQLGAATTEGLGAGAQPDVGRAGAEESMSEIMDQLQGSHMVFIAAGMGGGTGTGAAPVIARAVREAGILTVGVVTKPFALEGDRRMRVAEKGISELQAYVHTLIVIPNQNLFRVANERTTMSQAFAMADEVLHAGVRGITDLIVMPGLINLDFADIKSVINEMGKAVMGTGEAEGDDRAIRAAEMAISNPLLDDVSMKGAKGVLINITGGPDLMLFEVEKAADRVRAEVDSDANIIFGNTLLNEMEGRIRVSVVATGIDAEQMRAAEPPRKVTPIRPNIIKQAFTVESPRPVAAAHAANPVAKQVEQLANELNATPASAMSASTASVNSMSGNADEAYTLGGDDAPEIPPVRSVYPATEIVRSTAEMPLAPKPEGEKKSWGFFGRKKPAHDLRKEPFEAPRPQPAASAPGPQPTPPAGEDLFPEHGQDEQFEIPAFLRRQSN